MKRSLVLWLTGLFAGAMLVSSLPVQAGRAGPTYAQFRALSDRVSDLEDDTADLEDYIADLEDYMYGCFGYVMPISQYYGYIYEDTFGDWWLTSALDYTESGGTPDYYFQLTDDSCVEGSKAGRQGFKVLHPTPKHRIFKEKR